MPTCWTSSGSRPARGGGPAGPPGLGADRLITPAGYLLAYEEDTRLAVALSAVLLRPELTESHVVAWLDPVEAALSMRDRSTISTWVSNTVRTLRAWYLLVDRGVREYVDGSWTSPAQLPHRDAVKDRIAADLRQAEPFAG